MLALARTTQKVGCSNKQISHCKTEDYSDPPTARIDPANVSQMRKEFSRLELRDGRVGMRPKSSPMTLAHKAQICKISNMYMFKSKDKYIHTFYTNISRQKVSCKKGTILVPLPTAKGLALINSVSTEFKPEDNRQWISKSFNVWN